MYSFTNPISGVTRPSQFRFILPFSFSFCVKSKSINAEIGPATSVAIEACLAIREERGGPPDDAASGHEEGDRCPEYRTGYPRGVGESQIIVVNQGHATESPAGEVTVEGQFSQVVAAHAIIDILWHVVTLIEDEIDGRKDREARGGAIYSGL